MKRWVYADIGRRCGNCDAPVAAGTPILRLALPGVTAAKWRCETCAGPPNVEQLEEAAKRVEPSRLAEYQFSQVTKNLPFDPRMAQTGERDE